MLLIRLLIASGALVSTTTACGLLSRHDDSAGASRAHADVAVEVTNHNWSDITIYLVAGDRPQRLGMVTAMSNGSFAFPAHRLNTSAGVRLRALPVAGSAFTSETILVQPGQAIQWTLENNIDTSSLSVY
jgi:hypothetical protein